jgi:hypothetical protein
VYAFSFSNPLIDAADQGREGVVKRYLQSGHSVDAEGEFGVTALMRASFRGYVSIVSLLLENGANVNATDIGGATALHLAARNGYGRAVVRLLEGGASINAQDLEMWTPLMRAVMAGQLNVVDVLVEKGADITLVNQLDETVVVHCASIGSEKILEALEKSPAFAEIPDRQLETARLVSDKNGNVSFSKKIDEILNRRHGKVDEGQEGAVEMEGDVKQESSSLVEGGVPADIAADSDGAIVLSESESNSNAPSAVLKPVLGGADTPDFSAVPEQKPSLEGELVLKSAVVESEVVQEAPLSLQVDTRDAVDVVDLPWKADDSYASEYDIARSIFDDSKTFSADAQKAQERSLPLKQMEPKFSARKQGDFVVQLGTFLLEDEALYKWDSLKRDHSDLLLGFEPLVTQSFIAKDRVDLHRLRTGYFDTRDSATLFCEGLRSRELQCFVVQVGKERVESEAVSAPPAQLPEQVVALDISSERGEQLAQNYQRKSDVAPDNMPISLDVPNSEEESLEVPVEVVSKASQKAEVVELVVADDLIEGLPWLTGEAGVAAPMEQQEAAVAEDWPLASSAEEVAVAIPSYAAPAKIAAPVGTYARAPIVPVQPVPPVRGYAAAPAAPTQPLSKPVEGVYVPGRGGDYSRVYDPNKRYPVVVPRGMGHGHIVYQAPDAYAPEYMQQAPSLQHPNLAMGQHPGHVVYQAPDAKAPAQPQKPVSLQAPVAPRKPLVPSVKEVPVHQNPAPFDLQSARNMAAKDIVNEKRDAYFAQHGIKQPPQRYKEYGDFYQEIQSKGRVGAGVSEAVPVPDSSYFSQDSSQDTGERTIENWLQIGEFMNEQRANDYWLRMFRFNASLGHLKMVLFKPFSEKGAQSASIRVGPLSAGEGFEICEMVKASGKRCTVVSSDGLMSKKARTKEGQGYKDVPKGALQRWINLGAFADRKEAEYYWMFLKDDHQDILSGLKHAFDTTDKLHEFGDNATKLKIGPFTTLPRAQKICKLLMERNVACLVSK